MASEGVGGSSGSNGSSSAGNSGSGGKSDSTSSNDKSSTSRKSDKSNSGKSGSEKGSFDNALSGASKNDKSTSRDAAGSKTDATDKSTAHANEFSGLGSTGGPLSGDQSRNSHRGYGPDDVMASGIDLDDASSNGGLQTNRTANNFGYDGEFSGIGPNGASIDPRGPADKPEADTSDVNPPNESYPFAGDLQTLTLGANIDAPIVGDLTVGVTIEFGEEFDIGLMAEHGSVVSPYAIDNETGLAIAPDLSMGVNAYFNQGYVPFDSGHVDSKEVMAQYGLGPGVNFTHQDGITSLNVYGGAGAGASVTYDRTYNASLRDGVRWTVDRATEVGQWFRDSVR